MGMHAVSSLGIAHVNGSVTQVFTRVADWCPDGREDSDVEEAAGTG